MDWQELLFRKAYKRVARWRQQRSPFHWYDAATEQRRLLQLAAVLGAPVTGVAQRALTVGVEGTSLVLPEPLALLPTGAASSALVRALLVIALVAPGERGFFRRFRACARQYPGLRGAWRPLAAELRELRRTHPAHYARLRSLCLAEPDVVADLAPASAAAGVALEPAQPSTRAMKDLQKPRNPAPAERVELDRQQIEDYTLGHNFEKIETVEEFDGQWRDVDGEEDLQEDEAVSELALRHLLRSADAAHSTHSAEAGSGAAPELQGEAHSERVVRYPEWNYKTRAYRDGHCTVHVKTPAQLDLARIERALHGNRAALVLAERELGRLLTARRPRGRLLSGTDVDLDALVSRNADLRAGCAPSDAVYLRRCRAAPEVELAVLLDVSLSTDAWIDGVRVLDVELDAVSLLAEALHRLQVPFSLGAFYSRTRHECVALELKRPREPWPVARARVGGVSPIGYTRIGPALRHCIAGLQRSSARDRWIIMLTDARPNDYDRYEGRYGVEDVAQAVKEGQLAGVHLHAIAVGTAPHASLPAMMRGASHEMLSRPQRLSDALRSFVGRVLRDA